MRTISCSRNCSPCAYANPAYPVPLARALPAFTIHTAVKQAKKAFVNVQNPRVKTWGPTATGLAIVPILPYLFDKPVEHVTDAAFEWIEHKLIERQEAARKTTDL